MKANSEVRNKKTREKGCIHDISLSGGACLVKYPSGLIIEKSGDLEAVDI